MPFKLQEISNSAQISHELKLHRQPLPGTTYSFFNNKSKYLNLVDNTLPDTKIRMPWEFYFCFHPDDLEKAFEIVSDLLINSRKGHFYFTVADPNEQSRTSYIQNQITLYTFMSSEHKLLQPPNTMYNRLRAIEDKFCSEGIRICPTSRPFNKIPRSNYIEIGYCPSDRSDMTPPPAEQIQSQHNPYKLFTKADSPITLASTPDEISSYLANK